MLKRIKKSRKTEFCNVQPAFQCPLVQCFYICKDYFKFKFAAINFFIDQCIEDKCIVGAGRKAKVNFDNFGEKTLLLSVAKLKIHS